MTEQTKRQRKLPTTEKGRQLLAQQREELAQQEAIISEAMTREAQHRLRVQQSIASTHDEKQQRDVAVQRSIVKRVAASLGSENVVPLFDVTPAAQMQAYTDFLSIVVRYVSHDDIPLLAATLRGLLYHEGGHIAWTMPFPDLMRQVGVTEGSLTGVTMGELHHAWNAMEDQRMETAVTSDSPRKAAFFTPMVMTEMVYSPEMACANWPLLIWRRYLPKHIRDGARKLFVSVNSEALAQDMERVVDSYVKADKPADMWQAILDFSALLKQAKRMPDTGQTSRDHQNQPTRGNQQPPSQIPIDPTQDADEGEGASGEAGDEGKGEGQDGEGAGDASKGETEGKGKAAGKGETESKGGEPGKGEGGGEGQSKDKGQTGEGADDAKGGTGAGTSGSHGDDDSGLTQDDINDATAKAEEDRRNDSQVQNDVDAFHDAKDSTASGMAPYITGRWNDADPAVAQAEWLADDLVQSFAATTMDRQPGWVDGQRMGVLDVGRYMTRDERPGDMNMFRQYMDDDQPGQNLAVSVLLDYSGSMMSATKPLAQVGYACKLACQRLDIPCTVLLWDTNAKTLWDANEPADNGMPVIHATGGTNPDRALADLDNHRAGKVRHLVLIMTDGGWGWGADRTLALYGQDRYLFGIGYSNDKTTAEAYAKMLHGFGCNDAIGCTDLFEIPRALELLLIDMA